MIGFGEKLRKRAKELGISNAEVGRRAGLSEVRYGNYIRNIREPDFETLLRICTVLDLSPNGLLVSMPDGKKGNLQHKLLIASSELNDADLKLATALLKTLATNRKR